MARKIAVSKPIPAGVRKRSPAALISVVLGLVVVVGGTVWLYARSVEGRQPATVAEVKELLSVTTPRTALSAAAAEAMVGQIKASPGEISPKVVQIIPAEVDAFFAEAMQRPGGLGDELAPVIAQRFTSAEVRELLSFYRSPLGRKMSEQMPIIAGQTAAVAQQWTLQHWPELSQRVEAALKAEGVALPVKAVAMILPPPASAESRAVLAVPAVVSVVPKVSGK